MKRILLVLVAACSMEPPPVGKPAAAPAPPPPAPGCYTPTVVRDIDCSPGDHDEAAIYCAHVHDPCCGTGGQAWVCNNARYVDWYAQQCGH